MSSLRNSAKEAEAGNAASAVARGVDQASSGAHRAIDRAADATRPAVDSVASSAHRAVDKLAGAANQAAEGVDARGTQLRDAQQQFSESFRAHVRDKPLASLGLAVAAGFAISWLIRHR